MEKSSLEVAPHGPIHLGLFQPNLMLNWLIYLSSIHSKELGFLNHCITLLFPAIILQQGDTLVMSSHPGVVLCRSRGV